MKFTTEFVSWARHLRVHDELLRRAQQRLAPHPETLEDPDFYFGFLTIMVEARERYRMAFVDKSNPAAYEPIQSRNFGFLMWTNLVIERALVLIPEDFHWPNWTGSKLKKSEEAIRIDQKRPAKVLPPELAAVRLKVEQSIPGGLTPFGYLGIEAAGWHIFHLFMEELKAREGIPPAGRISFIGKANTYIRASTELFLTNETLT